MGIADQTYLHALNINSQTLGAWVSLQTGYEATEWPILRARMASEDHNDRNKELVASCKE